MRGNSSRSLELKEALLSVDNLLGEEGDQIWYIFQVIAPYFLIAMSGTYLGIASAALNEAIHHLSNRKYAHSGATLAQNSVLQHHLGRLWGTLERTRAYIYYAASRFDAREADFLPAILSAKAEVADCVVQVVNEVMTLTGGKTYQEDSRLHHLLRDARASHIMTPTTDILRLWTGRLLLDQPLLGD